jgi:hypothetical protein
MAPVPPVPAPELSDHSFHEGAATIELERIKTCLMVLDQVIDREVGLVIAVV